MVIIVGNTVINIDKVFENGNEVFAEISRVINEEKLLLDYIQIGPVKITKDFEEVYKNIEIDTDEMKIYCFKDPKFEVSMIDELSDLIIAMKVSSIELSKKFYQIENEKIWADLILYFDSIDGFINHFNNLSHRIGTCDNDLQLWNWSEISKKS